MKGHLVGALVLVLVVHVGRAEAVDEESRPSVSALRFDESALVAGFTSEVTRSPKLTRRALALWKRDFGSRARKLEELFRTAPDWRPILAQAAALVNDFRERSDLPRVGTFSDGKGASWVETLDPRTERRRRDALREQETVEVFEPLSGRRYREPQPAWNRGDEPVHNPTRVEVRIRPPIPVRVE